jgi:hypothetical protein
VLHAGVDIAPHGFIKGADGTGHFDRIGNDVVIRGAVSAAAR